MASIGTLKAKVLIQIGDGEPIEVGTMDLDLITKTKPATRDREGTVEVDAEAAAANAGQLVAKIGNAVMNHAKHQRGLSL